MNWIQSKQCYLLCLLVNTYDVAEFFTQIGTQTEHSVSYGPCNSVLHISKPLVSSCHPFLHSAFDSKDAKYKMGDLVCGCLYNVRKCLYTFNGGLIT